MDAANTDLRYWQAHAGIAARQRDYNEVRPHGKQLQMLTSCKHGLILQLQGVATYQWQGGRETHHHGDLETYRLTPQADALAEL